MPHQGADKSYGLESGKTQKDLTKLGLTEQDLDNAVLIEDNASYVSFGQARNFLEVPATTSKDFMFLDRNIDQFDKAGYFSVPVSVLRKPYENQEDFPYITNRRSIAEGGHIEVCRLSSGGYQIAYKRRGLQEYVVDHLKEKENHELCESLANLNYSYDRAYLKNGEVLKQIHAWIEERGGETKIKKLYHEANRIYYVAGILFTALEQARNEQRSLSSVLCEMQYTATGEGSYKPKFSERQKEDRWYHRGLSELRKVNSALQFTHPINYCETIKPSLTEEEKQIINTSLKNEDDNGCVIM
ncbi:MAG: hypothetical protein KDK72_06525 [Chlamydiia bacterium]|nr:hypothetical protein [Chlamydiia bacterium]